MTIVEKLKAARNEARKTKVGDSAFIGFVISEIETVGKKALRETTDDESVKIIRKIISNIEDNIKIKSLDEFFDQVKFLSAYLPTMVSDDTLRAFVQARSAMSKGDLMKAVGETFGQRADRKKASQYYDDTNSVVQH